MTLDRADERHQIDLVIDRLAGKRGVSREFVVDVVESAYRGLDENRIRDYIPLLVERRASRRLDEDKGS